MLQMVGIYSDIGASKRGSAKGVGVLMELLKKNYQHLVQNEIKITNNSSPKMDSEEGYAKNIEKIYEFFKDNLIPKMTNVFESGDLPVIFSGDHSSALGTIQAFKKAHKDKSLAIIWVDAHSDIHTPYDSSSGNIHGMPLGGVINIIKSGENTLDETTQMQWKKLCTLGGETPINPKNITYIGVRSMEKSERDIIKNFKIPLYEVSKIREDIHGSMDRVISSLNDVDTIYLSVDVDVMDGKVFTSTGVRENNGLYPDELNTCIELLIEGLHKKLIAIEFTEFNPTLQDCNDKDNEVLLNIVSNAIKKLEKFSL